MLLRIIYVFFISGTIYWIKICLQMKESVMKKQNSHVWQIKRGEEHSVFLVNGCVMETQIVWMEQMKILQHSTVLRHPVALLINLHVEMADVSIGYASNKWSYILKNWKICKKILCFPVNILHFTQFCLLRDRQTVSYLRPTQFKYTCFGP